MNPDLPFFAEDVVLVDGPIARAAGIPFPTRMIVVKLSNGALWVNSPVATSYDRLRSLSEWGAIADLVAPTPLHVWRLEAWHDLFPSAGLWTGPRIPRAFRSLPFAGIWGDTPPAEWANDFDQLLFRGNPIIPEVFFLHRRSRTVILADYIQNYRDAPGGAFSRWLKKIAGVTFPDGGVPLDIRLSCIHRAAARECLAKLLSWDFDKLIIAHGEGVSSDAKAFVRRAFRWLAG